MPFGFSFGGSKKKETSTSTGTSNTQTTATVPDWLQQQTTDLLGRNNQLAGANPLNYVAGSNQNLNLAQAGAAGLSGTPWAYDGSADLARGVSNTGWADQFINGDGGAGAKASTYINDYMNPYLNDVVNATSADLDVNDGRVRAQQALNMKRSGAFGGSGAALTAGQTEGELSRARGTTLGGLRSAGFDTAVSAAQGDAGRYLQDQGQRFGFGINAGNQRLDAGKLITDNANSYNENQRSNIGLQQSIGDAARGVANEQAQAPLALQQWAVDNLPPYLQQFFGSNVNETATSTTKGKSSGLTFGVSGGNK